MSTISFIFRRLPRYTAGALFVLLCFSLDATAQRMVKLGRAQSLAPSASVTPIEINGNPNCGTLNANNAQFPNITSDFELKIDSPFSHGGPWPFQSAGNRVLVGPTDLANTLSTSGTTTTLNFTSTKAISAVMIKAGSSSNVYYYPSGSFGDTNLVVANPNAISHVSFCYYQPASVTIIKSVTTAGPPPDNTSSTVNFPFTATQLSVSGFSLTDENIVGPDRYSEANLYKFAPGTVITVTENPPVAGFTLASISCTETAGGGLPNMSDSTTSLGTRTATIRLQQGENVTCTFHNTQLQPTAAPASVSGRVVSAEGVGISGVIVVLTDAQTGVSRSTRTSPFGFYLIEGAEVGGFYMLSVSSKRYVFEDATRTFALSEDLADVNFVASPY